MKFKSLWLSLVSVLLLMSIVAVACGADEEDVDEPAAAPAPAAPAPAPAAPAPAPAPAAVAVPGTAAGEQMGVGRQLIGKLEGAETITDESKWPTTFQESPLLAELVKAGKLPPVEERIGKDPLVLKPVHGIGEYGGAWRRGFTGPFDKYNQHRSVGAGDHLIYWDFTNTKLVPAIAKSWEESADGRVFTFHLREGMKWSDGSPHTANDYLFWYEEVYGNEELIPNKSVFTASLGSQGVITKVDDYTFKWTFENPYFAFPFVVAGNTAASGFATQGCGGRGGVTPAHYMKQFLPKFAEGGEEALITRAKEAGFENWMGYYRSKSCYNLNVDVPVLTAWRPVRPIDEATAILERNPYSIWVDNEGNQLPYIDRIEYRLAENLEILNLRAVAGDYDMQGRHIDLQKLPVFLENMERGNYVVKIGTNDNGSDAVLYMNQSFELDPEIGKWLRNRDFRRALSIGIDRESMNESIWLGMGVPGSMAPGPGTLFDPGPGWQEKWATYDPDRANQMLDAIGLTEKDSEGFRLRTDGSGKRLTLEIMTYEAFMDFTGLSEMAKSDWKDIGIDLTVSELSRALFNTRNSTNEAQLAVAVPWGNELMFSMNMRNLYAQDSGSRISPEWGRWIASGGEEGMKPDDVTIAFDQGYKEAMALQGDAMIEAGKELWRIALDEVWGIPTVGLSPSIMGVYIVSKDMGNVPERIITGSATQVAARSQTYYFKTAERRDSGPLMAESW